jgi:hypothetical protein
MIDDNGNVHLVVKDRDEFDDGYGDEEGQMDDEEEFMYMME